MPSLWHILRKVLRHRGHEVETFQRINQALNATLDCREVLQRIIAEIAQLLAAQSASVILYDDTAYEAEVVTSYGETSALQTFRYPLAGSLAGWVANHQRPLRVFRLTPEEWPTVWRLGEQLGAPPRHVSVLLAPLWVQGRVAGCLEAVWNPNRAITDYEEHLLETTAVQAAIAITNAQLYQEKERALQTAMENERCYRLLAENAIDLITRHTAEGVFLYTSPASSPLLGYAPSELVGRSIYEFLHPDELETIKQCHAKLLQHHDAMTITPRIRHQTGQYVWCETTIRCLRDPATRIVQEIVAVSRDITERRQAEEKLQYRLQMEHLITTRSTCLMNLSSHEIEHEITAALQAVGEFAGVDRSYIFLFSEDGTTMDNTHEWCAPGVEPQRDNLQGLLTETFPWWIEHLRRRAPIHIPHVADLPLEASAEKAILQAQAIQSLLVVPMVYGKSLRGFLGFDAVRGEKTWAEEDIALLKMMGEIFAGALERQRAEEALQQEVQISTALVRVGQALITSLDTPTILDHLCQVTTEVLACDASHTFLWTPEDDVYVPVSGYGGTPAQWEAMRVMRIPSYAMAGLLARLRQEEVVEVVVTESQDFVPLGLAKYYGVTAGLYMALRRGDELIGIQSATYRGRIASLISQQKRIAHGIVHIASLALNNARLLEQAESANRLKSDFLATISHELRTPLNAIMGYTDLMLEESFGPLQAEQHKALQAVRRAAHEEFELITATLDVSRLETGRSPVDVSDVNISALMEELQQEITRAGEKPSLAFVWRVMPELPQVHTDRAKLKIILKNLLSNAVKFTEQGSVTVEVNSHNGGVEFDVTDSGIGITPEVLPVIFDPFRQGDSSTTRRYGGMGLGLYIVRRMVELLEGMITVESAVGKGSTFRVWIPITRTSPPQLTQEA
jgi:PAS domain S-box-containing protein